MAKRGNFATKFGVLMATVGSAVGLGNIWRFPYQTGVNGGGAFLLIYVICVLLIGIPAMTAEFIVGRETHKNAVGAFEKLDSRWSGVGYLGVLTGFIIDCYYCVVTGWTLYYLYLSVTGSLLGGTVSEYASMFHNFSAGVVFPIVTLVLVIVITGIIISKGVQNGIEKASKIMMPMLFILLVILAINSCTLEGASEGLNFLLIPDFSKIGLDSLLAAAGQAFFSLSLGMGCLITYSSYFTDDVDLAKTASQSALIDMLVAIVSGIIIFPAVFSFGMEPEQGPGLVFKVLPNVFTQMGFGTLWAIMFYLLLFIAALTSFISITEVVVAYASETFKISRRNAVIVVCSLFILIGIICSLSFGPLADVTIFGMNIFDSMDYLSTNIMLPLGGILTSLFVGWSLDRRIVETQLKIDSPVKYKVLRVYIFFLRIVVPIAVTTVFIAQFLG